MAELSPSAFLHQPGFGVIHWELFNRVTRVVDVAVGALLLVLACPSLLLAGLAVLVVRRATGVLPPDAGRASSAAASGSIKLRTMRRDAEEDGPAFAAPTTRG